MQTLDFETLGVTDHYQNTELEIIEVTDDGNFRLRIRLDRDDHFASDVVGEIIPCVMREDQMKELEGFLSMYNPTKEELIDELIRLGVSIEC